MPDIDGLIAIAREEMGITDAEAAVMKALHDSDYGDLVGLAFLPAVARIAVAAVRASDPTPAEALEELAEYRALQKVQWRRMAEATERWRAEDPEGRALILPDLGVLLRWLMDDADRARAATGGPS